MVQCVAIKCLPGPSHINTGSSFTLNVINRWLSKIDTHTHTLTDRQIQACFQSRWQDDARVDRPPCCTFGRFQTCTDYGQAAAGEAEHELQSERQTAEQTTYRAAAPSPVTLTFHNPYVPLPPPFLLSFSLSPFHYFTLLSFQRLFLLN